MEMTDMNSFQWRTVAVLIRGHLNIRGVVSTKRAQKIVAQLVSGEFVNHALLHAINNIRLAECREIPADSQFGVGA
jgi:hypothetical protein